MIKNIIKSLIVLLAFLIGFYGRGIIDSHLNITNTIQSNYLRVLYAYAWWILPSVMVIWIFYGYKNIFKELKLDQPFGKGLLWAAVMVSPMIISSAILGIFNTELTFLVFIKKTLELSSVKDKIPDW